ncbi:hypothetical protein CEP54_002267 [Fusarium duplospermum]|uniref:Uncharacterized protein n=1 Tax=Fusarium duplospermum TaxID=1325734 RepID=A0A428QW53_9HYPO|nr:hypothetical protein CEP54_002267 [Fusarium duplospermum]
MGGKVWSTEEERVFWEVVVPVSPNAANPAKRILSWVECVDLMKREIGANARREYTHTMLYEHHYQNFKPGAKSPKANAFLEKHLRDIEWFKENKTSPPPTPAPAQAPTSDEALASLLNKLNNSQPKAKRGRKIALPASEEIEKYKKSLANPTIKPTIRANSSSFTPINQRLCFPEVTTDTTPARNTVANSFANPAACTFTSADIHYVAKLAVAAAAANSLANPLASNPGVGSGSLAFPSQRQLPQGVQRQFKTTQPTQTVRQPTTSQAPVTQASTEPNALLGRQTQSFGNGMQDVRRTQSFTGTGTANQARGSSSYAPFYQGYPATSQQTPARASYQTSTQAPRQSPAQSPFQIAAAVKEEGPIRLPSIREMFPFTFVGPEQEAFARRDADAMLQNRKRSTSAEDEQSPAPKRRPLPDHPTSRQN